MMTIILVLGMVNVILILFQLVTGFHIIKIRFKIHRFTGLILAVSALAHGILAIIIYD
jgi:hypothetical protein